MLLTVLFGALALSAQTRLTGTITDADLGETLIGASVLVKGTAIGTVTDNDGNFELTTPGGLPVILQISYIGFTTEEREVTSAKEPLNFSLGGDATDIQVVEVTGRRISEKQQNSVLTVETMDAIAIKETAAADFYDGLGSLKDVDLTSASLGFKIINTRGFNSTNPVRSLQLIDGVDNQSPGLNFSLGNFLGASDLDVNRVTLVVGASSAFYGPNAFNGVIAMETKDPFLQQGLSATFQVGERNLLKGGFRWAQALQGKSGKDWFAYKINFFRFQANDWVADNYEPVFESESARDNPGGYDAVNIYGDEYATNRDFTGNNQFPGLGVIHRQGYREIDLVDYDSENTKLGAAFHFRLKPDLDLTSPEIILATNYSEGTTVFQGDNRFSLRDIRFFQHRVELRKRDNYFLRFYATHEDAGNSYDPYFTALRLQERHKTDFQWLTGYVNYWSTNAVPVIRGLEDWPSFQCVFDGTCTAAEVRERRAEFLALPEQQQLLNEFHDGARVIVNRGSSLNGTVDFFEPGTERFQQAFDEITTTLATKDAEGGTRFYDKSALFHGNGEKLFPDVWRPNSDSDLDLTVGASARVYTPDSRGTILLDTNGRDLTTAEFGVYGGGTLNLNSKYRISASLRADKNQNFDLLFSPAASIIYTPTEITTLRASFSSAIRNPTLNDQYLFYNVGRAILIGNLEGFDSLVTVESLRDFSNSGVNDTLNYFNVAPIQPEQVRTFEVGVRTTLFEKLYIDATYYYSFYNNFIGFNLGVDLAIDPRTNTIGAAQAYRVAANATDNVTTQGFSIGTNYYFGNYFVANANYSFNRLNSQSDDPIIPAFNTPEHKYNIGVSGRNVPVKLGSGKPKEFGFNFTYKWVDGFIFEGSPQFTGFIDSYGLLDGQVNYTAEKINTTFKLGASNLLNNEVFQVYGGPLIGRMAYFSLTYNWQKR